MESDPEKLALHKAKKEYTPIQHFNKEFPPELVRLLERALEPKAEKRLQSLYNIEEILSLWAQEANSENKEWQKELCNRQGSLAELKKWLKKRRLFKNTKQIKKSTLTPPMFADIKPTLGLENDFFIYKITNLPNFIYPQSQEKIPLDRTLDKNKLIKQICDLENERQELILLHTLIKQLIKLKSRQEIFLLLNKALALIHTQANYALLAPKSKMINNKAQRVFVSQKYSLNQNNDDYLLDKAAKNSRPKIIKRKNMYVLLCPLISREQFFGTICITHTNKIEINTKLRFYSLLADIIGVVEISE